MPKPLLVLFDLDGTMLLGDAYAHGRAMVHALREVYGCSTPDNAVMRVQPWGKTDVRIAREVLRAAGLSDRRIDERLPEWMEAAAVAFDFEAAASGSSWKVRHGLTPALAEMGAAGMRLSLLTGNLRPIAVTKLERIGVVSYFDLSSGAFGSDAEERAELPRIARRSAGDAEPWPRKRTVLVGDTPADIAAARADGVRCLVFSSTRFPPEQLKGASAVVCDPRSLAGRLKDWDAVG